MSSLVPDLVKKWCKPISAESHDSVTGLDLVVNLQKQGFNAAKAAFAPFAMVGNVFAAVAA